MTTPFTITTPTNAILLDTDRRGLVVFTVANQTGRSLRVRMSVSPFAPASADWFKVEGEAERLLPLGSSDTGTVRIAVPPDVAPGPQNFRLDVVSVERPDEEWAHGPAVGFQIPAPPPPKPEPSPATGYVETTAGAVAGAIAGILVAAIASLAVWALSGRVRVAGAALAVRLASDGVIVALTYAKDAKAAAAEVKGIELDGGKAIA